MDGLQQCMRGNSDSLHRRKLNQLEIYLDSLKEYHRVNNALPEKSSQKMIQSIVFFNGFFYSFFNFSCSLS